jgi:NAD(P)-dependent dehydrogenase (short-subunit alcohol dehydrogenase family)
MNPGICFVVDTPYPIVSRTPAPLRCSVSRHSNPKTKESRMTNSAEKTTRVWLVTGASSGFGRAAGEEILERGDRLAATSRNPEKLEQLVSSHAERALALRHDVTDPQSARDIVNKVIAHFGRVDVVLNNAGFGHIGAVEELTDEELCRQIDVNLFGMIHLTRAVLPYMRKQRSGHILQMSSLNGIEGMAGGAYYAASKFAIEGFSESLAAEVAPLGIRVTIIEPGPFRTDFLSDRSEKSAPPIQDYADSVGKTRDLLQKMNGKQPGDPALAAKAFIKVVEAERPPLRVPLGAMAYEHIRSKLGGQLKDLDSAAPLGEDTDFSEAGAKPEAEKDKSHEALVRQAYAAFNQHQIEAGLSLMDSHIDWPISADGRFVRGTAEVRKHWSEQFKKVDPRIDVLELKERKDGNVEAHVRQVVKMLDGSPLSDDRLTHVFAFANDRIRRMDMKSTA